MTAAALTRGTESMPGDAWTITRRQFWHWRAQPAGFAVGLLFPVLVTLMFGALLNGIDLQTPLTQLPMRRSQPRRTVRRPIHRRPSRWRGKRPPMTGLPASHLWARKPDLETP